MILLCNVLKATSMIAATILLSSQKLTSALTRRLV